MKTSTLSFLLITVIFLSGCQKEKIEEASVLLKTQDVKVQTSSIKASSIFEIKRIIPLETTDESLIGRFAKLIKVDKSFYILTFDSRLLRFDENGKFIGSIGTKGEGPHEYTYIEDFDADRNYVYILNENRLLSYLPDGTFVKETPLSIKANSFKVMEDSSLLFHTTREDSLIYQLNATGQTEQAILRKNASGRLTKSIAFKTYKSLYIYEMGRSNELVSYNPKKKEFKKLHLTDIKGALTSEKESEIRNATKQNHQPEFTDIQFNGPITFQTQLLLGSMKNKELTLWTQTVQETKAYAVSSIENDLTYIPFLRFLMDNTFCSECFLSYCQPYLIAEGLEEHRSSADERSYQRLQSVLSSIENTEEANPIIFEYILK